FFGTGHPGPDYYSNVREGDNLYTASVVALDVDTGKLGWHYQFTPHDVHDWDSTQVPVLADVPINGQTRKVIMFANRNGFFYTLDRTTGKVIVAKPFVETTWAKEIGPDGRPMLLPGHLPDEDGTKTCPDLGGGTNFMSPSYDPVQRLFFVTARETCANFFAFDQKFKPGEQYESGGTSRPRDQKNFGVLRAIDPVTATVKWEFRYPTVSSSGVLTTASGLVFAGDGTGNIMAFESRTGKNLWHYQLGASMSSTAGTTYMLDGRQFLLVPAGSMMTAFALPRDGSQAYARVRARGAARQPVRRLQRQDDLAQRPQLLGRGRPVRMGLGRDRAGRRRPGEIRFGARAGARRTAARLLRRHPPDQGDDQALRRILRGARADASRSQVLDPLHHDHSAAGRPRRLQRHHRRHAALSDGVLRRGDSAGGAADVRAARRTGGA